ncbi:MBL fold metallo-hydrolase [Streptococcus oricebi]|uniref:MBL fold metallo-hydrolase n=1 Tax=Streptococcus oricebi TaxID=1547447 RepID=A0ABS5B802_9STRE|nr:MBL fold metallo-hydrolase [Streptococcus oricebi]MBP2624154.1 MBL fold metallo-hydrolase [Streptococcus oricebi]
MSNIIESLDYFPAGYCKGQLASLFKGQARQELTFPAGVFLIKHRDLGYILYDTGYSLAIKKTSLKYFFYRLATPIELEEEDQIDHLLEAKGIKPEQISYLILSHLHPDHIGGSSLFPKARFILTQEAYETYRAPRFRDLVFKEFLPADFEDRLWLVQAEQEEPVFPYCPSLDLFGDGSIYLASLDGHARGQACLFLPEHKLMIAADLTWGMDLLAYSEQMRLLPRLIQENQASYFSSIKLLRRVLSDQIQVVVSHDPVERIERILYE